MSTNGLTEKQLLNIIRTVQYLRSLVGRRRKKKRRKGSQGLGGTAQKIDNPIRPSRQIFASTSCRLLVLQNVNGVLFKVFFSSTLLLIYSKLRIA